MTTDTQAQYLSFGDFRLDCRSGELRKNGREIRLQPQPAKLLVLLATRRARVVTRGEIQKTLWGDDTFVDFEHGINFSIKQIREALGDSAEKPRYIETVPRVGYRFVAIADGVGSGSASRSECLNRGLPGSLIGAGGKLVWRRLPLRLRSSRWALSRSGFFDQRARRPKSACPASSSLSPRRCHSRRERCGDSVCDFTRWRRCGLRRLRRTSVTEHVQRRGMPSLSPQRV